MKLVSIFLGSFLLFGSWSCTPPEYGTIDFSILPSPHSFVIFGTSSLDTKEVSQAFEQAKSQFVIGESLANFSLNSLNLTLDTAMKINPEGYELEIKAKDVGIKAGTDSGLWYGLMTLGQLLEDAKEQNILLPLTKIKDEPALGYRAVHLDVKHHLENKAYYYQLIDRFSALKINAIILEIEDKLAYQLQPKVGSSDAFSIEEWKEISAYAMARNIRISPLVQGLGHASFVLKHEEYLSLRDDPASDWAFDPLNEETYKVQFDLYEDALKAFPFANFLHVGGDEVHTTGRNSGKSALELQLIWLNKVSKYAESKLLTPIFWDDMPLQNAGVYGSIYDRKLSKNQVDSIWEANEPNLTKYIDLFPKNCVYMRWNYNMPESPGNNRAIQWFRDNDFQVMGATAGQTRWNLMPLEQSNINNIRDFAMISIRNQADGLLLTLWDDDSPHFELYGRGIAIFAEYTWAGQKRSTEEFQAAFRQRMFGSTLKGEEFEFIDSLEGSVAFWKNALLDSKDRNNIQKMNNPIENALISLPNPDSSGVWTEKFKDKISGAEVNFQKVEQVLNKIEQTKKRAVRNLFTLAVYEQVAKSIQFSNRALLALSQLDQSSVEEQNKAKDKLAGMEQEWREITRELESVYSKTRSLHKPIGYVLDQDHHNHLANQALNFSDWQFYVEDLFLQKIEKFKK